MRVTTSLLIGCVLIALSGSAQAIYYENTVLGVAYVRVEAAPSGVGTGTATTSGHATFVLMPTSTRQNTTFECPLVQSGTAGWMGAHCLVQALPGNAAEFTIETACVARASAPPGDSRNFQCPFAVARSGNTWATSYVVHYEDGPANNEAAPSLCVLPVLVAEGTPVLSDAYCLRYSVAGNCIGLVLRSYSTIGGFWQNKPPTELNRQELCA